MSEPSDERAGSGRAEAEPSGSGAGADEGGTDAENAEDAEEDVEALRERVEEKYDFENFGPEDMAAMTAEEWEAAFDADTWITGPELLDRVEADLKDRVRTRDVFARVERLDDGRVVAYSDSGWAVVHPDGSVEGQGTVLRDVKPTVALCSMEDYDVPEKPEGPVLPEPADVPEGGGELGNWMLQIVGAVLLLSGVGLVGAWLLAGLNIVGLVVGLGFLLVGLFMFVLVANARLSDRFRAEEFRERLRAVGTPDDRPDFLPIEDGRWVGDAGGTATEDGRRRPVEGGETDDAGGGAGPRS